VFFGGGKERCVRATIAHGHSEALGGAECDVHTKLACCHHHHHHPNRPYLIQLLSAPPLSPCVYQEA